MYYIHPELRIGDCRSWSGKGARPLRGSSEGVKERGKGALKEHGGASRKHRRSNMGQRRAQ